jgi:uncharacterized membrane protein YhhN
MPDSAQLHRSQQVIVAVCLLACAALVAGQLLDIRAAVVLAKLIASSSFIALAISVAAMRSVFGRLLFAGLVLSWIGDMLLLGATPTLFLAGLVAFLLAHLMYVSSFIAHGVNWRRAIAAGIPVVLISASVSVWLTPHVPASMQLPVWLYTVVISGMVMSAFGARGAGASLAIPVGALLFYLSDLSVAAGQFIRPEFPNYVWGLPFYYAGQLLLAGSAGTAAASHQSPSRGTSDAR